MARGQHHLQRSTRADQKSTGCQDASNLHIARFSGGGQDTREIYTVSTEDYLEMLYLLMKSSLDSLSCFLCQRQAKNLEHLLLHCPFSQII